MRSIVYCHHSDLTFRHLSQSVCMCVCVESVGGLCDLGSCTAQQVLSHHRATSPSAFTPLQVNKQLNYRHASSAIPTPPRYYSSAIIRNLLTDGGCTEDTSDTIFSWRELTVFSLSGHLSSSFLLYILTHLPSFYCSSIGLAAAACAARP